MKFHRFSEFALVVGLLTAPPALADVPSATTSTVPDLLTLVAHDGSGAGDQSQPFTVVVRKLSGQTMAGADVVFVFDRCTDLKFCTDQGDPNVAVSCAYHNLRAFTGAGGAVTFHVTGGAVNEGAAPGPTGPAMDVYADGVLLKTVRVAAFDQIGLDGMDGKDLSAWLADYFSGQPYARSDYDGDGVLSGTDFSLFLAAFFSGASAVGCGSAVCP